MLDWHELHGRSVARTARHFGFSRPTVYRWLARYDRLRLESLEDRPSRPVRRRRPTWTLAELVAVRRVRLAYPRWGKDKLRVLLRREGLSLSTSMVGRILTLELRSSASARSAVAILDALAARMPFGIRALSVDNGSEFMAEFEASCAQRGIALLTLPPRSPKLNGSVERANRTHTEEFYEVTDAEATLAELRPALLAWETTYNTIRPHQALGYLTPAEYLASLEPDV
jgi:transposase InsO family protein